MILPRIVSLLVFVLAWVGCGGANRPGLSSQCLRLSLPNEGVSTSLPAKVSLFFTVDTCDGKPLAGLSAQSFSIAEDGKPVSTYESRQNIEAKGQKHQMYSLLLLDLSGSILRSGAFDELSKAANLYVDQVLASAQADQAIGIYSFDGRTNLSQVVGFTSDAQALKSGIDALSTRQCTTDSECACLPGTACANPEARTCAGWRCVDDSTNLNGAVINGVELLEQALQQNASIPFKDAALVVMTDGSDQAARVSEQTAAAKIDATLAHVFTIGLGGDVDTRALKAFGKDGFEPAANAAELSKAFTQIADRIVALSSRFYLLEYCSPKRNGVHKLTVDASWTTSDHKILAGSLSGTFNANGFESGCQL